MKNYNEKELEVIDSFYTDKAFVKIKNKLTIGKILFAFADIKDAKNKKVDYYMDAVDCLVFVKKILSMRLERQLLESLRVQQETKAKYPKEVWDSLKMPANEEKTVFKEFHIGPSTLKDYALSFRANQGNVTLFVAVASYDALLAFAEKMYYVLDDYMKSTYTVAKTTSKYDQSKQSRPSEPKGEKKEEQKEEKSSKPSSPQATQQTETSSNTEIEKMHCKTESEIKQCKNGDYCMKVTDKGTKQQYFLIFPKNVSNTCSEWQSFNKKVESSMEQNKSIVFSILFRRTGKEQNGIEKLSFTKFNM